MKGFDSTQSRRQKVLIVADGDSVGEWLVEHTGMARLHIIAAFGSPEGEEGQRP